MYVNATAGTTVYGAFDPINQIADICEKYNMWLHVDVRCRERSLGGPAARRPPHSCVWCAGRVGRRSAHVQETPAQAEWSGEVKATPPGRTQLSAVERTHQLWTGVLAALASSEMLSSALAAGATAENRVHAVVTPW